MSVVSTLTEGPAHAPVVPTDTQDDAVPDDSWTLEDLRKYALDRFCEVNLLAKRSTVQIYRAGWALSIAQKKEKDEREWVEWQKKHGLKRTTVWEAIKLYERAPSEEAIKDLAPQKAKEKYGVTKKRKSTGAGSSQKKKPGGGTTQHRQEEATQTTPTPVVIHPADLDDIGRNLGPEYRQAILSGEAQLSSDEIRTLAGGDPTESRPPTPVVVVLSSAAWLRQEQAAPVGLLEHRTVTAVAESEGSEATAVEEEPVDENLVEQANDLVRRMNHATRLAFVGQPLVLAAVRRLPPSLTAAA